MVRIKVLGTKQQINVLTKAAKYTGLATPSKFLAALFDGNHFSHDLRQSAVSPTQRPSNSRRRSKL